MARTPGGPLPVSAVALAAALRSVGVQPGTGQVVTCARAFDALGPATGDRYWAGRISLVTDPADLVTYDRVFRSLVEEAGAATPDVPPGAPPARLDRDAAVERPRRPGQRAVDALTAGGVASATELLRHRRFDAATEQELEQIGALVRRLSIAVASRASRQTRPGRSGVLDLARTLERAMATDGELVDRAWRRRRVRPRRMVVALDVSGSMAEHARVMLRFALAARRSAAGEPSRRVEVFAFGTRLTRISDELAVRDADAALAAAAARVVDWDGGTRIGDSLEELVRVWGRRGVLRGAVVVVCSDGLERGDPMRLGAAAARLRRACHRLLWVNPLAGDPQFAPTQRGMAAALPSLDALLPGHDLASLEELSQVLSRIR